MVRIRFPPAVSQANFRIAPPARPDLVVIRPRSVPAAPQLCNEQTTRVLLNGDNRRPFAREQTGEGQHIRLAMLDTMIAYLWPEAMTQYMRPYPR
jgi:hypothetical protein